MTFAVRPLLLFGIFCPASCNVLESKEISLPVDAATGVCAFQVKFQSLHNHTSFESSAASENLEQPPPRRSNRSHSAEILSPGSAMSLRQRKSITFLLFREGHVAAWTSLVIIFLCLCCCGSVAGEFLLGKLARYSTAVRQLSRALGDKDVDVPGAAVEESGASSAASSGDERPMGHVKGEGKHHEDMSSGKLYEEYLWEYWTEYSETDAPDIFEHDNLRIVKDGGMKDVERLRVKYMKAVYVLVMCVINSILILVSDIAASQHIGPPMVYGNNGFLLTTWLHTVLLSRFETSKVLYLLGNDMNRIVPVTELAFLIFLALMTIGSAIGAVMAPYLFERGGHLQRWASASTLFWYCIPQLMSCSALRLLHFVTPNIFFQDGYTVFLQSYQVASGYRRTIRHYAHSIFTVVWFLGSRFIAGVLGFDAFLVKFRLASSAIDSGNRMYLSELAAITFMWQVMGIIHLKGFVEKRLFIFMFAGRRGNLDIDEEALIDVWKALVTKKVYEVFGFLEGTVVMLGFDTYDLQFLALEDDEDIIRQKVSQSQRNSKSSKRQLASKSQLS